MKTKPMLGICLLLLAVCLPWKAAAAPNIIYIIVDDMGPYDVGCYGSKWIKTPNIDRLAAEGMRFTQAYSGCSVCAPARSTLMTGKHTGHTTVRGNTGGIYLRAEDVTVAEVLKKAGYAVGGFGKWGVGDLDTPGAPEKHGFDRFYGYYHQVHAHYYFPHYLIDTGRKVFFPENKGFYDNKPGGNFGLPVPAGKLGVSFSGYPIFEEMKKFIRANKDKPFFCYAPWTPPHGRFEIPEDDPAWQAYRNMRTDDGVSRVHAAFCSMMDRQIGETLELLEELGVADDTIIFFSSDNGAWEHLHEHIGSNGPLRGVKGHMYEGGIRVPFIVRWPGKIRAGSTSDLPVYFPDFLPTAAELTGTTAHVPDDTDGMSIVPELLGKAKQDRERTMYWELPRVANWSTGELGELRQGVRRGQWKIVRSRQEAKWELYDLSADMSETNDLADVFPEIAKELSDWIKANRTEMLPQIDPALHEGKRYR